jgi:hypothetical protein
MKLQTKSMFAFVALAFLPVCQAQSPAAGDWQGTLTAGGTQFHIVWHVIAAGDGSLTATVDNPDQGVYALPVKSMTLKDGHITQIVDTVIEINGESHNVVGKFEGTIDKGASEIKGTWSENNSDQPQPPVELDLKRAPAQTAPKPAMPPQSGVHGSAASTPAH